MSLVSKGGVSDITILVPPSPPPPVTSLHLAFCLAYYLPSIGASSIPPPNWNRLYITLPCKHSGSV